MCAVKIQDSTQGVNLFSLCIIGVCMTFSVCYISTEHNIYYWDYIDYQITFQEFGELLKTSIVKFIFKLHSSVASSEYNAVPILLPLIFYDIFGSNRTVYIASLLCIYYIPSCLSLIYIIEKYNKHINTNFLISIIFLFTPFLYPTLRGYLGIGGLIPLSIALYIALFYDIHKKVCLKNMFIIGVMIYICFLFRRWYIFTVISFYISYFLYNIFYHVKSYKIILYNIIISGMTTLALVLIFQFPLIFRTITTNYYYAYTAFSSGILANIKELFNALPGFQWLCIICAAIYEILYIKEKKCLFLILFVSILIITFNSMQHADPQHRLPIFYILIFIFLKAISDFNYQCHNMALKYTLACLIVGAFLFNFLWTFSIGMSTCFPSFFIQSEKAYPLKHPEYEGLVELTNTLKNIIKKYNAKITIFGTSGVLNESMIRTQLGKKYNGSILSTSQIDQRDGIPTNSLRANFVVITNPIQYQFSPNVHTVITIPSQKILHGKGIGKAFEQYKEPYDIGNGIHATIYRRLRDFTYEEWQDYINSFPAEHINWYSKNR